MLFESNDVVTVAESIKRHLSQPEDAIRIARLALESLRVSRMEGKKFLAKTVEGKEIIVHIIDKGDMIPGYDANGNRYEAYTTYFMLSNGKEFYSQVDRMAAEKSGDVAAFRIQEDLASLKDAGVDIGTFRL